MPSQRNTITLILARRVITWVETRKQVTKGVDFAKNISIYYWIYRLYKYKGINYISPVPSHKKNTIFEDKIEGSKVRYQ